MSAAFHRVLVTLALLLPAGVRADAKLDARTQFAAGVTAAEQQRFGDAAVAFEQAYRLEPAWQVLYNLGTAYAALGRPVEAVDRFQRYLAQSDASVSDERRREVHVEIERQRAKIGWLELSTNEPGAELLLDGQLLGRSPLTAAVPLAAGTHGVEVHLPGYRLERRDVEIETGRKRELRVDLERVSTEPARPTVEQVVNLGTAPSAALQPTPAADSGSGNAQRAAGWVLGGAGLAGAVVAAVLVAKGQSKHLDAVELAKRDQRPAAEALESSADRQKLVGYATAGVSAAVFLTGAILLLSAPENARAQTRLSGWASASSAGVLLDRSF